MTERHQELRDALHHLGDAASPADLTSRARERAGQIRRRRVAAVAVTATTALVITIGGTNQLLADQDQPNPAITPTDGVVPSLPPDTLPPTNPPTEPPTSADTDQSPSVEDDEVLPSAAPTITGEVVELERFDSPTGNLRCLIAAGIQVSCEALEHTYTAPPKPTSCAGDWGHAIQVDEAGTVEFGCYTDTVDPTEDTLEYGQTTVVADFACQSRAIGVTCWDQRTGRGFSISRGAFALF